MGIIKKKVSNKNEDRVKEEEKAEEELTADIVNVNSYTC